jgi:hypothetical protein
MGILDNLENAWDEEFLFESKPIVDKDAMGREKFWEDLGRPDFDALGIYSIEGLALQEDKPNLLIETCCSDCTCGK